MVYWTDRSGPSDSDLLIMQNDLAGDGNFLRQLYYGAFQRPNGQLRSTKAAAQPPSWLDTITLPVFIASGVLFFLIKWQ